ncbi:MAG: hypothetical protein ACLS3G_10305, partial [Acutalibacteraceae bacterium]
FKSFCPCQNKKTPAGVFLFWFGLNNLNTRHAERVEGCGSPVETSARSAEAPTEPAGETKSFCPCQKETVTVLVTVSFLLDKICPRHARAGLRRRALPVADAARRGWSSGQKGLRSNFKSFREDTIEICTLKLNGVFYRIQYSCGFLKLHFSFLQLTADL